MTQTGVNSERIALIGRAIKYKKIHCIVGLEEHGETLKNVRYVEQSTLLNSNGQINFIHINEIVMIGKDYVKNAIPNTI